MKDNKMNSPFFARFLECSIDEEMSEIKGQKDVSIGITSVQNDNIATCKYPSDNDEDVTLKYPSDNDEDDVIIAVDDQTIASTK